jgi:hypothetical protein
VVTEEHVGGRTWRSTRRRPRQLKEAADSVLQRFFVVDGGSAAGLAWLRGAREWCVVVNASALLADECGDDGAEVDSERQSGVGRRSMAVAGRGENDFSFRPTVRGDDARGDGCMCRVWSGRGSQSTALTRGGGSG